MVDVGLLRYKVYVTKSRNNLYNCMWYSENGPQMSVHASLCMMYLFLNSSITVGGFTVQLCLEVSACDIE